MPYWTANSNSRDQGVYRVRVSGVPIDLAHASLLSWRKKLFVLRAKNLLDIGMIAAAELRRPAKPRSSLPPAKD